MNLDDAIGNCIDVIKKQWVECKTGCVVEHAQLLLWLIELKERREIEEMEVKNT